MKKIEIIWREILETGVKNPVFEQKELAEKFNFSTSTVFAALKPLKQIGAVIVSGRNFKVTNFEKILLFWATHRNLNRDIIYQTLVDAPVLEIEGLMPSNTIYAAYSAGRQLLKTSPADYDKVYIYGTDEIKTRFPKLPGSPNLFALKPDPFLEPPVTSISQTFVDLWNLPDWYAADFLNGLKEKYYGFLH